MSDFLLELRSEEIPARMQAGARAELERLFRQRFEDILDFDSLTVWSTPRRLALIVRNLSDSVEPLRVEVKGPPVGAPDAAVDGFCRKNGLERGRLEIREDKGREVYFSVTEIPGRPASLVLAEFIPELIRTFSWPKSMRWGAASLSTESLRWVRPLSGIVAIFGEDLVECEVDGIRSGYATMGHRFHHSGAITIGGAHDYAEKLRACHVIVDHEERQDLIRQLASEAARTAGFSLVEDEGLVIENAGLTEWPVPLLGRFDREFLDVPPEVIQLTARVNQKYFVCTSPLPPAGGAGGGPVDGGGSAPTPDPSRRREGEVLASTLANAFVCTANIDSSDCGAAIVDGNRKVLAARLSDARFFWEQDRKTPLAEHAKKLARITFHEKLGTVADKVERVAKLARWLVEEGIVKPSALQGRGRSAAGAEGVGNVSTLVPDGPHPNPSPEGEGLSRANLADLAEQAARLCKADLVTEMVGEFPELQGVMGGYYARAEGLPDEVADAIRDHYKPVGQGDDVPTAPVTVAVSLADKLDTLIGFFYIGEKPTGSKDPFALRRAAIGAISIATNAGLRFQLYKVLQQHWPIVALHGPTARSGNVATRMFVELATTAWVKEGDGRVGDILEFFADRLKVQQREAGVRHDLIDAVFALGGEDDLVRLLARVHALQAFVGTEDGANLLAGYKRSANILKKEDWHGIEGEIPQTGEEDPLAIVDDPDLKAVVEAKMAERHAKELSYTPEPAEKALIEALDAAEPRAASAIEAEDFAAAMSALASLRAPIDRFFEDVIVNAEEEAKRTARLELLARFRDAVHRVADFSRIEG
jgi:glycyl-tRNA synthetase beta chain